MIIKHLSEHKIFWFLAAVSWAVFIGFSCLIDSDNLPSIGIKVSGIDKIAHFLFHFIFTVLWAIYCFNKKQKLTQKTVIKIILMSLIFGVLIEWMQGSFTRTRTADVLDVISNFLGAIIGGMVIFNILKKQSRLNFK